MPECPSSQPTMCHAKRCAAEAASRRRRACYGVLRCLCECAVTEAPVKPCSSSATCSAMVEGTFHSAIWPLVALLCSRGRPDQVQTRPGGAMRRRKQSTSVCYTARQLTNQGRACMCGPTPVTMPRAQRRLTAKVPGNALAWTSGTWALRREARKGALSAEVAAREVRRGAAEVQRLHLAVCALGGAGRHWRRLRLCHRLRFLTLQRQSRRRGSLAR